MRRTEAKGGLGARVIAVTSQPCAVCVKTLGTNAGTLNELELSGFVRTNAG
jgi:hypothetical protein